MMKWLCIYILSFLSLTVARQLIFASNQSYYLVIDQRQSWAIIHNGIEAYYLELESNVKTHWGDILWIQGSISPFRMTTYEGLFSFPDYLKQRGVAGMMNVNQLHLGFRFPFRFDQGIEERLRELDSTIQAFVTQLLWKRKWETSSIKTDLFEVVQYSGLGFYLTNRWMDKILKLKLSEDGSRLLRLIVFFPFLLMNLRQFGMIRVYGIELIRFMNPKKNTSLLKVIVVSIQSWIHPFIWLQESTFVYLVYQIWTMFFIRLFPRLHSWKRWLAFLVVGIVYGWFKEGSIFNISIIWFLPLSAVHSVLFPFWLFYLYFGFSMPGLVSITHQWVTLLNHISLIKGEWFGGEVNQWMQTIFILLGILIGITTWLKLNFYRAKLLMTAMMFIIIQTSGLKNYLISEVFFINVGQGDATLIVSLGKTMLIDTGGVRHFDMAKEVLIPFFKKLNIRYLDYLVITHPDFDHDGAMDSLLESFRVRTVITTLFNKIKLGKLTIQNYQHFHQQLVEDNERSLVLGIQMQDCQWLVMGDATIQTEAYIQRYYPHLTANILRMGHHGSNTSSSIDFLTQIKPKEAVISLGGGNRYGHPHPEVLTRMQMLKIKIRRTDIEGTIRYQTCNI